MSTQKKDPPIDTIRDGQTFIKVWRNWLPSGDPIYSSTTGYTYTDKETGEARDSKSLRDSDLLKMPELAPRARAVIRQSREADRAQDSEPSKKPQRGRRSSGNGDPSQSRQPDQDQFRQSRQQPQRGTAPDYSREP